MRMNHLDLHVPDVAATRDFFVTYFGLRLMKSIGDGAIAILHDDAGLELVLSRPIAKLGGTDQVALAAVTYHIGFMLPAKDDVDRLYERLRQGNAEELRAPRSLRGAWLFYCFAPGGILVEVGCRAA